MTRGEMKEFVEDQLKKIPGDRENAIRMLAFAMDEDDPCENGPNPLAAELWFQQKIAGG